MHTLLPLRLLLVLVPPLLLLLPPLEAACRFGPIIITAPTERSVFDILALDVVSGRPISFDCVLQNSPIGTIPVDKQTDLRRQAMWARQCMLHTVSTIASLLYIRNSSSRCAGESAVLPPGRTSHTHIMSIDSSKRCRCSKRRHLKVR